MKHKPFKVRGRFDIVVPFEDGSYMRITSDKDKSLTGEQIAKCLREYADQIDVRAPVVTSGVSTFSRASGDLTSVPTPSLAAPRD